MDAHSATGRQSSLLDGSEGNFNFVFMDERPASGMQGDHFSQSLSAGSTRIENRPELNVADVYERVAPAVVSIPRSSERSRDSSPTAHFHAPQFESMGSGFVVDAEKGVVVTNWHVAEKSKELSVNVCGQNVKATVIGVDPHSDLAFLQLDNCPEGLTELTLGDTTDLRVGDQVMTIGSPFGLDGSVGTGIISGPPRKLPSDDGFPMSGLLQHSAMINPGNSGGVLIDSHGKIVGMNTAIPTTSGGFQGIGLAVAAEEIREALEELRTTGVITREYTGMHFANTEFGVALASVDPGSPAADLGISAQQSQKKRFFSRSREVDLEKCRFVTHINGTPIASSDDVAAALEASNGSQLDFTLKSTTSGDPYNIPILPEKRPVADMLKLREVRSQMSSPGTNCSHLYLGAAMKELETDEIQALLAAYSMVAVINRSDITVHVNPSAAPAALLEKSKDLTWLGSELESIGFTVDPSDNLTFRQRMSPFGSTRTLQELTRISHGISEDEMARQMDNIPPGLLDMLRKKLGPGLGGGMLTIDPHDL